MCCLSNYRMIYRFNVVRLKNSPSVRFSVAFTSQWRLSAPSFIPKGQPHCLCTVREPVLVLAGIGKQKCEQPPFTAVHGWSAATEKKVTQCWIEFWTSILTVDGKNPRIYITKKKQNGKSGQTLHSLGFNVQQEDKKTESIYIVWVWQRWTRLI